MNQISNMVELVAFARKSETAGIRYVLEAPAYHPDNGAYFLATGSGYQKRFFSLSVELGKKLNAIWKQAPVYRGSEVTRPVGSPLLSTILDRLGESGAANEIAEARREAQRQEELKQTNTVRKEILSRHADLLRLVEKYGGQIGVTSADFQLTYAVLEKLREVT